MRVIRFRTLQRAIVANLREDRHVILINGEEDQRELNFKQLYERALSALGALQNKGLAPGDPVVLFVNDNERFLETFWACVLGRMIPVPITVGISDEHRHKLFRILAQLDRAWVYSDARTLEMLDAFAATQGLRGAYRRLERRALLAGELGDPGPEGQVVVAQPDDTAFIQYSSGSTSEPKGVVLTHRNVTANIASILEAGAFTDRDISLSWMPLTHDMGLIGFHLNMLAGGVTHAIMRTALFARQPLLWLRKATELRASILCSPNFGYQHYLKQYVDKRPDGLELSAVRLIFNGAEPISYKLCKRFVQTMAVHGLPANGMYTVYGLAEASLAVTFPEPGSPVRVVYLDRRRLRIGQAVEPVPPAHPQAAEFVTVGRPVPGTGVRIVGDEGVVLVDGRLGHIQIRGENVTQGYYKNDTLNAESFTADGWLRTGDLGFLTGGELVITGRSKDILFVRGQNYHLHDLERIAEQVPGIETHKVVFVGVHSTAGDTEEPVAFVLHRDRLEDFVPVVRALRRVMMRQAGLEVAAVLPVKRIPKTTSGKLQRYALKQAFEEGEFEEEARTLAQLVLDGSTPTQRWLLEICERLIPEKHVGLRTDLFEINLNSLTLTRLHAAIDERCPGRLEVADLFDYPTLEKLAAFLDHPT